MSTVVVHESPIEAKSDPKAQEAIEKENNDIKTKDGLFWDQTFEENDAKSKSISKSEEKRFSTRLGGLLRRSYGILGAILGSNKDILYWNP